VQTIVFIDAQNLYLSAREAFGWENESSRRGNFLPLQLGRLIVGADQGRVLKQVRVYTGIPSQERDKDGYRAARSRFDTWRAEGGSLVEVFENNLQYRRGEKPREKGVDVRLAIDLVRLCIDKEYDVGIVVSADNDLVPALEFVADHVGSTSVESVALRPELGCEAPFAIGVSVIPGERAQIRRRVIGRDRYETIEDLRSYKGRGVSRPATPGSTTLPGQSGRALPKHRRPS
jgi:uncharacterized LabA/DUF88 family protein